MNDYLSMSHEQLLEEQAKLAELYAGYQAKNLKLDMSRGKPCVEQLDLSKEMYQMVDNYIGENGVDARNYGLLEGMPEARRFLGTRVTPSSMESTTACILGSSAS